METKQREIILEMKKASDSALASIESAKKSIHLLRCGRPPAAPGFGLAQQIASRAALNFSPEQMPYFTYSAS